VVPVGEVGILGRGEQGAGQNETCGNEAVDFQHGTGVGGSSHPRTKGYYPK
jgi:hypothetical protein